MSRRRTRAASLPEPTTEVAAAVVLEETAAIGDAPEAPFPIPTAAEPSVVEGAAAAAALLVLASLLLAMLTLVTRFLRGTWDP